jgi:alcohol dehydrogenase
VEETEETMKALVYHGPGEKHWESKADPGLIDPTDAVVRIDTTTICGTDLHILKGDVPAVTEGRTLGHEAVGTVVATGSGVRSVKEGDRVLVSCISACGRCAYCRRAMFGQCLGGGGWILGHLVDGVQAQYARIPFADNGLYLIPEGLTNEQVLLLADILPTGYEIGVLNGRVKPGDVVAIVGVGPVGLAALMTSRLFGPSKIIAVDLSDKRLARAQKFGADSIINSGSQDAVAVVRELTGGLGADVAIEAVGLPATFELCLELVRAGGHVANVGVHGKPATIHLDRLWIKNITITTGLVDTSSTPTLLQLIAEGRLDPLPLATHRFKLDEIIDAWDVFADAAETDALKVVLAG